MLPDYSPTPLGSPGHIGTTLGLAAAGTPGWVREVSRGRDACATCWEKKTHDRILRIRLARVGRLFSTAFWPGNRAPALAPCCKGLSPGMDCKAAPSRRCTCRVPGTPQFPAQTGSSLRPPPAWTSPRSSFLRADCCWRPSPHTEGEPGMIVCQGGPLEVSYVNWGIHRQDLSVGRMEPGVGREGGGCRRAVWLCPFRTPRNLRT